MLPLSDNIRAILINSATLKAKETLCSLSQKVKQLEGWVQTYIFRVLEEG